MANWHDLIKIFKQEVSAGIQPTDLADAAWLAAQWGIFDKDSDSVQIDSGKKPSIKPSEILKLPESPDSGKKQPITLSGITQTGNLLIADIREKLAPPSGNLLDEDSTHIQAPDDRVDVQLPDQKRKNQPRIICPAPATLKEPDKLAKALRSFHQRIPSRFRAVVDERATVESIIENNYWEPVLQYELERRFDVALVVEKSVAMGFWHNTVKELKRLLVRKGVFRDVRVWSLLKQQDTGEFVIWPNLTSQTQAKGRKPKTLTEPNGRKLILLISDCVSDAWYNGSIVNLINQWAMPVALLQMLPEKLWQRTGLSTATPIRLLPKSTHLQTISFKAAVSWMVDEEQLKAGLFLPIAILEPSPLKQLAQLVTGNNRSTPGFYLANKPSPTTKYQESKTLAPKERLKQFWHSASPNARQLAKLLAAAPRIRLPIIRLIREAMLKEATHIHEAEFLLSGLLEVDHSPNSSTVPDEVDYDFIPEVRDELLDAQSIIDSRKVLEKVSQYVEQHLEDATGFAAVLANPTGDIDSIPIGEMSAPFATIATSVLKRLGGRFKKLLEKIEHIKHPVPLPAVSPIQAESPIQVEIAEINAYLDNILADPEEFKRYIDLSATIESKTITESKQFNPEPGKTKSLESISEALKLHDCFVLLGAPGAGKSMTLKKLQFDSAKSARKNPNARIPILINLALWQDDMPDLQEFLDNQLKALPFVPLNRALLLLDGLNEMPPKKYVERVKMFEKWLQIHPKLSVIIGCRKQHYQQNKKLPLPTVQIAPLDGKRIQLFLQAYLDSEEAATQLLTQLEPLAPEKRSARDLIHLADNPYLLFMICSVYTQNQKQLPSSRGQLFQMFVQVLYKREQDKGTTEDISYEDFVLGLSDMAFAMQRHRSSTSVHTVWLAKQIQIPKRFSVDALWRLGREASLLNLLNNKRIVQFTHQLILEYLAAEGLLRRFSDLSKYKYIKKPGFFKNQRGSGAWDEVIYTSVGITDANPFLVQLAKIDPFLAVDCFEHVPQEFEVTDETKHVITRLLVNLFESKNSQEKEAAISKIISIQLRHIALPYLIDLLEKGNKITKRVSFNVLARLDDEPLAMKAIVLALENNNKWVRKDAEDILDHIAPSKFEALAQEQDEKVVAILEEYGYLNSYLISLNTDKLTPKLKDENPKIRKNTIKALGQIGDSQIIDKLIPYLQDEAPEVRGATKNALVPYLQDKAPDVRVSTINALAKSGDAQIVDKLIPCLQDEHSEVRETTKNALVPYLQNEAPNVRVSAINALAQLGDAQIIDKLIPCLQDEAQKVRVSAITALAKLGDAQIVGKLIPCLQDEHSEVRETTKNTLVQYLQNEAPDVRVSAITALAQLGDAQIVDKLIPYLQDEAPNVRVSAINALAQLGDAQIVDKLIPCLQDKAPNVRDSTIIALAKLGDAQIVDKLIPCLQDKAQNVRDSAITALAKLGDAQIVDKLIPYLQDKNPVIRGSIINVLTKLDDAQIVGKLIPYLQDENPDIRASIISVLTKLGDAQIVDKLIPCLQDEAPNVRASAISALAQLGDAQIVYKLIPCLQDEASDVRVSAITALAKLGDAQIVDKLVPYLQDEASDVRVSTITALAKLGDVQIVDKLIPCLQDEAPGVRSSTIIALKKLGDAQIVDKLIPYLQDEAPGVRDSTIIALAKLGDAQIVDKLIHFLQDEHSEVRETTKNTLVQYLQNEAPDVRVSAITVLAKLGDAQIVDKLVPYLQDEAPNVRVSAINALEKLGDAQIVDKLVPYLQDKNLDVRVSTINVLAKLGDAQIVDKLIPCLQDEKPDVRDSTIIALAQLGDAQIIDKLIPCLQDEAPSVRASTISALAKLGDVQIVDKLIPCLQDEHPEVREATKNVLIPYLQDKAPDVRASIINALTQLGDSRIVDKLIPCLQDEHPEIREATKNALVPYLQDKAAGVRASIINALAQLDDAQIIDKLIPCLEDKLPTIRATAINALAQLGDAQIVDKLIPCLQDKAQNVRDSAITALAELGDVQIVDKLIPYLQDEDPIIRGYTITALAELGDAQTVDKLIPYLQDKNPAIRASIISVLKKLGDVQIVDKLIPYLQDEDPIIRGYTITALAKLGDAQIVNKIIPYLQDEAPTEIREATKNALVQYLQDEEPDVRASTINALAQLGDAQIVDKLIPCLQDEEPDVRASTINALAKLGDAQIVDKLIPCLQDEEPDVRNSTIIALAQLGDDQIIDKLILCLQDEAQNVRSSAKTALRNFGYNPDTLTKL